MLAWCIHIVQISFTLYIIPMTKYTLEITRAQL